MAHKRAGGSSRNGRDSNPNYHGVKVFGGQKVEPGHILVRQMGTKYHPGFNVDIGRDDTLFALSAGTAHYRLTKSNSGKRRMFVDIIAADSATLSK